MILTNFKCQYAVGWDLGTQAVNVKLPLSHIDLFRLLSNYLPSAVIGNPCPVDFLNKKLVTVNPMHSPQLT